MIVIANQSQKPSFPIVPLISGFPRMCLPVRNIQYCTYRTSSALYCTYAVQMTLEDEAAPCHQHFGCVGRFDYEVAPGGGDQPLHDSPAAPKSMSTNSHPPSPSTP